MNKVIPLLALLAVVAVIPIASAQVSSSIPDWIKNNAGWWADGQIPDSAFIDGIEYLIKDGIIVVSNAKQSESQTDGIPEWIKNNAGWWADGRIPDSAFIDGIEYLIKDGIIRIS